MNNMIMLCGLRNWSVRIITKKMQHAAFRGYLRIFRTLRNVQPFIWMSARRNILIFPDEDVTIALSDLTLNLGVLTDILCKPGVGDEPITVIGITGPTRSGKSFLMSTLIRYLQMKGWSNEDWIDDVETCQREGFSWQQGIIPHTEGVKAWNHIFRIPWGSESMRNVLLLDTQGLYRSDMTKEHNARLFATMMLFCDTLMLNIEKRVDERELESLEVLSKYASAVIGDMRVRNDGIRACQNLTFILRDWQYPQDYAFGHAGGNSYLMEYLQVSSNSKARSVRENIRSAVASIDGFLMPHPAATGDGVNFSGAVQDMSIQFRECMDELARNLFNPWRLERNMLSNQQMTGQQLLSLMKEFSAVCDEREADETLNKIKAKIDLLVQGDGDAGDSFCKLIRECLQGYDQTNEDKNCEFHRRVILKCQEYFRKVSAWGELRVRQADNLSLQVVHKAWAGYKANMKKDIGINAITDEELRSIHENYQRRSDQEYQIETMCEIAYVADHAEMLGSFINESYEKFNEMNIRRQGLEQLSKLDDVKQYEAQMYTNFLVEHFTEQLEEFTEIFLDEEHLNEQIGELQSQLVDAFQQNWDRKWPLINSFTTHVLNVCESEHVYCVKCNARNKVVFLNIIEEYLTKAKVAYREVMEEVTQEGYHVPAKLQKHHEQAQKIVTDQLKSDLGNIDDTYATPAMQQLNAYVDAEYLRCSRENKTKVNEKASSRQGTDVVAIWRRVSSWLGHPISFIKRATATVRKVHGVRKAVLTVASTASLVSLTAGLPYVILGVDIIVGLGVLGYSVYKWYKEREKKQTSLVTEQ